MLNYTNQYIQACVDVGILSTSTLRKYPLRQANLATVIKAYAISTHQPYDLNLYNVHVMPEGYYLTDGGLEWFMEFLNTKKHLIGNTFLTEQTSNYEGLVGDRPKVGTKRGAILVIKKGRVKREHAFDTLREARNEVFNLLRFYPEDTMELYRLHKNGYRVQVPLILEANKRGAHLRK